MNDSNLGQVLAESSNPLDGGKTEEQYLDSCRTLRKEAKWNDGLRLADQGLAMFPDSARLMEFKALFLSRLSKPAETEAVYLELAERHPARSLAFSALANLAARRREWQLAVERWTNCVTRFPNSREVPAWLTATGSAFIELERLDRAEWQFSKVTARFPEHADAWVGLAQVAELNGQWELAAQRWQACLEHFPQDSRASTWQQALQNIHNQAESLGLERKAAGLSAEDGLGMAQGGNTRQIAESASIQPAVKKLLNAANVALSSAQYSQALECYESIMQLDSQLVLGSAEMTRLLCGLYLEAQDYPSAGKYCEALLEILGCSERRLCNFFRDTLPHRVRTKSMLSGYMSDKFDGAAGPAFLADKIREAHLAAKPLSLIRLGDGEGLFLCGRARTLLGSARYEGGVYQVSDEEYATLLKAFVEACVSADIIGLPREDMARSRGYMNAISYLPESVEANILAQKVVLTDCHCHWGLLKGDFFGLFNDLEWCGYIGGRDVSGFIKQKYNIHHVEWYQTPAQANLSQVLEKPHYPDYYYAIMDRLNVPLKGRMFIVAAGFLGKIYCSFIRQQGGVAIDVGAVADVWDNRFDTRGYVKKNFAGGLS
jgi:tetratricopeptide (TPR) repeat protein